MKLFGKDLFDYKKEPSQLYDFAQHGLLESHYGFDSTVITNWSTSTTATSISTAPSFTVINNSDKKEEKKEEPAKKTPKELFEAKALNNNEFKIRIDKDYLNEQIDLINLKLKLMGTKKKTKKQRYDEPIAMDSDSADVRYGREELESILLRLKNRSKITEVQNVVDKYPHTTSEQLAKILEDNNHLRCQKAGSFIPDLPKEAIKAMQEYDDMCVKLCNMKTNFYVVADKKDFEVKNRRRDPILVAQSPFGFFWQILGAWDKEMIFLGDL